MVVQDNSDLVAQHREVAVDELIPVNHRGISCAVDLDYYWVLIHHCDFARLSYCSPNAVPSSPVDDGDDDDGDGDDDCDSVDGHCASMACVLTLDKILLKSLVIAADRNLRNELQAIY